MVFWSKELTAILIRASTVTCGDIETWLLTDSPAITFSALANDFVSTRTSAEVACASLDLSNVTTNYLWYLRSYAKMPTKSLGEPQSSSTKSQSLSFESFHLKSLHFHWVGAQIWMTFMTFLLLISSFCLDSILNAKVLRDDRCHLLPNVK